MEKEDYEEDHKRKTNFSLSPQEDQVTLKGLICLSTCNQDVYPETEMRSKNPIRPSFDSWCFSALTLFLELFLELPLPLPGYLKAEYPSGLRAETTWRRKPHPHQV